MRRVATVDVGRSRWKIAVWQVRRRPELESRAQIEVRGGRIADLRHVARQARAILEDAGVSSVSAFGGDALRRNGQVSALLESYLGARVMTLTPGEEGRLFLDAVQPDLNPVSDAVIVDIGGGSVQIVNVERRQVRSVRLGTYEVESAYDLGPGADGGRFVVAGTGIGVSVARSIPASWSTQRLTVGSNNMASFLESFCRYARVPMSARGLAVPAIPELVVKALAIRGNPDNYAAAFPALPQFMSGASQALIVMLAVAEATRARWIVGTDLGISHGAARRLTSG